MIQTTLPFPRPTIRRGDALPQIEVGVAGLESDPTDSIATAELYRAGTGQVAAVDLEAIVSVIGSEAPWGLALFLDPANLANLPPLDVDEEELRTGRYFLQFKVDLGGLGENYLTIPADSSFVIEVT